MEDPEERWPFGDWQAEGVLTEQLKGLNEGHMSRA